MRASAQILGMLGGLAALTLGVIGFFIGGGKRLFSTVLVCLLSL
jgi:hypothetical protein